MAGMMLRITTLQGSCQCGNNNPCFFRAYDDSEDHTTLTGVACKIRKCGTEYLTEALYPGVNVNNSFIIANGVKLYRKAPTLLELDPDFQTRLSRERIANVADVTPGDHVCFDRWYLLLHHAIVTEVRTQPPTLVVEGWDTTNWEAGFYYVGKMKRVKRQISENEFQYMYKFKYSEEVEMQNPPQLVLARCRALSHSDNDRACFPWLWYLGKLDDGYGFFNENCEHHAMYAKIGCRSSNQIKWLWLKIQHLFFKLSADFLKSAARNLGSIIAAEAVENLAQKCLRFARSVLFEGIGLLGVVGVESYAFHKAYEALERRRLNNDIDNDRYQMELGKRVFEFFLTITLSGGGGILAAFFTSSALLEILLCVLLFVAAKAGMRFLEHFIGEDIGLWQWMADRLATVPIKLANFANSIVDVGRSIVDTVETVATEICTEILNLIGFFLPYFSQG